MRVAHRRAGHGPPLVLLHGALSDSREWRPQLESLSDGFDVIAWDAPGCGESDDPPTDFGIEGFADSAAQLIRDIGVAPASVGGLSFGGGVAIALYERHPELVRSLLLFSAYAGWRGSLPAGEVEQRLRRALRDADRPPETFLPDWLPELMAPGTPPALAEEMLAIAMEFHPQGAKAMARAFALADLRHVLPTIRVPTLVVHGELDVRAPFDVASALHAAIPESELVVLPGAGHQCNLDAPERFDAVVRRFLERLDL